MSHLVLHHISILINIDFIKIDGVFISLNLKLDYLFTLTWNYYTIDYYWDMFWTRLHIF